MLNRLVSKNIDSALKRDGVVIIVGQRQVGKTSELLRIKDKNPKALFFDFEDFSQRNLFKEVSVSNLSQILGSEGIVLFDEIHKLNSSGSILKLIHDHLPNIKVVASGSASFLLLKNIGDSLYGRKELIEMYPLTFREMLGEVDNGEFNFGEYPKLINKPKIDSLLQSKFIFGSLPKVFLANTFEEKKNLLEDYIESFLLKDIFEIERIKNPDVFRKLLTLVALQLGSEINANEIAQSLGTSRTTILDYIEIFEKFYIIKTLRTYSTNKRKEISKKFKVYFTDIGVRNALIKNYASLDLRADSGAIFENVVINEVFFNSYYFRLPYNFYFWKDRNNYEVDLVLENQQTGLLTPVEIKLSKTTSPTRSFFNEYKEKAEQGYCINTDNFWKFI